MTEPMPVPGTREIVQFTDAEVMEYRRWADEGTMTHYDLARETGINVNTARRMLCGEYYAHVPNAVAAARFTIKPTHAFSEEEVVEWRRRYRRKRKTPLRVADIAKATGKSVAVVQKMLHGARPYHLIPDPVPADYGLKRRRNFTGAQVAEMRREYRRPDISLAMLSERFGGDVESVAAAILGRTYKEVKEPPLAKLKESGTRIGDIRNLARRKLTPEQVLFLRLQYDRRKVSTIKLAAHYKLNTDTVRRILKGTAYKEVPGAHDEIGPIVVQVWTDEEVLALRRAVRAKEMRARDIVAQSGASDSLVSKMLAGDTYAHVPEAIPKRWVKPKAPPPAPPPALRKPGKPIPIRPVRLLDHDERVDLVSLRARAA